MDLELGIIQWFGFSWLEPLGPFPAFVTPQTRHIRKCIMPHRPVAGCERRHRGTRTCPLVHDKTSLTNFCVWEESTSKDSPVKLQPEENDTCLNLSVGWSLWRRGRRWGSSSCVLSRFFMETSGLDSFSSEESRWPFLFLVHEQFPLKSSSYSWAGGGGKINWFLCRAGL